jgi:hypothetical protein
MQFLLLRAARSASRSFFAAASVAVLVAVGVAGCDSKVDVEDGGGEGECCLMDPQCPAGSEEVDACSTGDCFTVEACCTEKLCEPGGTCAKAASCEPYEQQVATCEGSTAFNCRTVTECGATIFCEEPEFCAAVPSCDDGDEEQPNGICPEDIGCYQVELCGNVILCADFGLAHGCPSSPPAAFDSCATLGLVCDYPINDCIESWVCADPAPPGEPGDFDQNEGGSSGAPPPQPYVWQSNGTACSDGSK